MDNKKYQRSLALMKRMWKGEEGDNFANKDLAEWFKVYNQTQLNKAQKSLKKIKQANDEEMQVGADIRKF